MARREMVNDRGDSYNSRRDYQTVHTRQSTLLRSEDGPLTSISFADFVGQGNVDLIGFGGYIRPTTPCEVCIRLAPQDSTGVTSTINLSEGWNRFGIAAEAPVACSCIAVLSFSIPQTEIEGWGIGLDSLSLPEKIIEADPTADQLSQAHLAPETFYLPTEEPPFSKLDGFGWTQYSSESGVIHVKKCAYCQRYLPLTPESPGGLAFHKHRAKVTGHQNECRSCKKWRINDDLNELRTPDQFHESSTISRERRLLLREPQILQGIKEKHGQGLKSLVWERFDRKCFNCRKKLKLNEVQLDHTRPLAYLWPIDEHATCLCSGCNNHKGDKFPVDFYSHDQLRTLSEITGLPFEELTVVDLSLDQLDRIKSNIEHFVTEWSPVTLQAINRKITEIRPEEDLLKLLKHRNADLYRAVTQELSRARDW